MAVPDVRDPAVQLSIALNLVWGGADRVRPFFDRARFALVRRIREAVGSVKVPEGASSQDVVALAVAAVDKVGTDPRGLWEVR